MQTVCIAELSGCATVKSVRGTELERSFEWVGPYQVTAESRTSNPLRSCVTRAKCGRMREASSRAFRDIELKHEISSPSQTGIGSAVQTVYGRQELTVLCPSAVGVPLIANVNCIGVCFSGSPFRAGLASPEEHAPMQLPAITQIPPAVSHTLVVRKRKVSRGDFL